jgi:prepilin-type processing-associated H-X9-DG protein
MYEAGNTWFGLGYNFSDNQNGITNSGVFYANPFVGVRMGQLECPSETGDRFSKPGADASHQRIGSANYAFSGGDWQDAAHLEWLTGKYPNYVTNPRAVFDARNYSSVSVGIVSAGWPLGPCKSLANISDGTSNTVVVSESCQGNGNIQQVKVGVAVSNTAVPVPLDTTYVTDAIPNDCMALAAGNVYAPAASVTAANSVQKGVIWIQGIPLYNSFHTILPPNGPTCIGSGRVLGWAEVTMKSAGSYHPGGVNCALFDGSVRLVSDTVSCVSSGYTAASARCTANGSSQFGVWGALGSINGGESQSLP